MTAEQPRFNWSVLALAWLIYFAFGMVMASLVPIITLIRDDLGISYSEMGGILGAWQLVYIFAAAPAGVLIDRIGPKRALVVGALIITGSAFLRSFAGGFGGLFTAVALFGLGGPIVSVGLSKLIADWFTGPNRGLASGIYMTGPAAGSVLALALMHPVLLPLAGSWRAALLVYAAVALAIAFLWLILGRDSPQGLAERHASGPGARGGIWEIIKRPSVWIVVLLGFSGFMASHGLRNWLPQVLEAQGASPSVAGLLGALPALTGIFGSILVVRAASTRPGNRRPVTILLMAASGLSIAAIMVTDGWLLVLAIAVQGFCAAAVAPLMLNTLMEMPGIGARHMGVAAGLYFSVGEAGGALAPFAIGVAADLTGSFMAGMLGLAAFMLAMVIPALRIRV